MRTLAAPYPTPKQWGRGTLKSPEHVAKVSAALLGHPVSEETKQKIRDSARTRRPSEKTCSVCGGKFLGGGSQRTCLGECQEIYRSQLKLVRRCATYRITVEYYLKLVDAQGGCCAICTRKPDRWLCVDHDHVTDEVRGLLCESCNLALGKMQDDPALFDKAAQYLRKDHA